jgi:dephospho-CoA kinase
MMNKESVMLDDPLSKIKNHCIALTGGIATGKSFVGSILKNLGYTVIDADQLAREVVQPQSTTLKDIKEQFGGDILTQDGDLKRSELRELITKDSKSRKKLEAIMHPAIQREFEIAVRKISLEKKDLFFYEASLIFELERANLFKECWVTYCSEQTQIERLQSRSNLTREECLALIKTQMPVSVKVSKADKCINTDCSRTQLEQTLKALIKETTA